MVDGYDGPGDVWSGDSSNLPIVITQLTDQDGGDSFDVVFTGSAEGGSMNLSGDSPDGSWTLTATEG